MEPPHCSSHQLRVPGLGQLSKSRNSFFFFFQRRRPRKGFGTTPGQPYFRVGFYFLLSGFSPGQISQHVPPLFPVSLGCSPMTALHVDGTNLEVPTYSTCTPFISWTTGEHQVCVSACMCEFQPSLRILRYAHICSITASRVGIHACVCL